MTQHAQARMLERGISDTELLEVIESGTIRKQDEKRMWIYKALEKRADNLICAAVVEEDRLIVKTVMINWQLVG
ncbi:MAG: DUF4258 domain-containing protein [Burkholderiales bacterium]